MPKNRGTNEPSAVFALGPELDSAPDASQTEAARAYQAFSEANPFAAPSRLPLQAPDFDAITSDDFMPAIEAGMAEQNAAVKAIANNADAPTFDNTIVALEKSDLLLSRVMPIFHALAGANTNPTLQHVEQIEAPRLAALADAIYLDELLFERVTSLHDRRDELNLDPESRRLLEKYHEKFLRAGAHLAAADKSQLREINKQLSSLSTAFAQKLLAATASHAPVFADRRALAGLSEDALDRAAAAASDRQLDGQYVLSLQNTTQQPLLAALDNRDTREALHSAACQRAEQGGDDDTRDTIETIAQLRAEKARLLGHDNFAAYKLGDQMASTPANARDFMQQLAGPAKARLDAEAADLQALIEQSGESFELRAWDWNYYAKQLRQQRFDFDETEIKPYFELDRVLRDGVFHVAEKLYGLAFEQRHDLPVYAPGMQVFTVYDADTSVLGLFYTDYYTRDNKNGGAWMSNFVGQSRMRGTQPVIYNVLNLDAPAPGAPTLLSHDEVITLFHEFGHALHGFFADTEYPMLSGTATPRDFVELPSQLYENWAIHPDVFDHYVRHHETHEPMPAGLKKKLLASTHFNQGYRMSELISAALLDMAWHTLSADAPRQRVDAFERQALAEVGMDMPNRLPPRYRSSYFRHIWGNGYAAGYYAYLWARMLADDGFTWFTENGGLTRDNGERFRRLILSIGNTKDLQQAYDDWRGRPAGIGPMLENRGLAVESQATTRSL